VTGFVRITFVLLILLSLGIQVVWLRLAYPPTDRPDGLVAPLESLGLHTDGPDANGLITATTPACDQPVNLALLNINGVDDATAEDLLGPTVRAVYAYLGVTDDRTDRVLIYRRWLRATIAAFLGSRRFRAPARLVIAALPQSCPNLAGLDWGSLSP